MKSSLLKVVVLLTASFLSSCAANTFVSQLKQTELSRLNLPFKVIEVEIKDGRINPTTEDIKLPIVSKPGSLTKHVPALTTSHLQLIEEVVRANTTNSGPSVKAIVNIPDSYKEFSSTWSNEQEKGFAQIQISFVNPETGDLMMGGDTSGEFFVQSADATNKRMEEIYILTLKNVTYNCLKLITNQVKK